MEQLKKKFEKKFPKMHESFSKKICDFFAPYLEKDIEMAKPFGYLFKTSDGDFEFIEFKDRGLYSILEDNLFIPVYTKKESEWISIKVEFPKELETVWLYNINNGYAALGCMVNHEEGWGWALSNGQIYSENGVIIAECEMDDDYEFTHFSRLPRILKKNMPS